MEAAAETTETYEFKSEAKQLLSLMIHSLYSNKDVFLRELISNASDAIDKLRFEALTDASLMPEDLQPEIRVWADASERTLTIADNGIGMTRDEVIANLGTIAKSGTKEFAEKLREAKTSTQVEDLIGQFGVGFYSSFIVADRVRVVTRKAGTDQAVLFESSGDGTYAVGDAQRDEPGTTITLHLRDADEDDNLQDFTEEWPIRATIKKYSDFIQYPIRLRVEREEVERDEDGNPVEDAEPETVVEWDTINSMKAIWTRSEGDVEEEEYNEFYKHIAHDWSEPLDRVVLKAEGTFMYYALLFIPSRAPFDLFYRDAKYGLQLYVNRVLVMEETKELLPDYLRFVKGVVDSPDLSLNVSREILQRDRRVNSIRKRLIKKVLDALETMQKEDRTEYAKFWQAFGRVLKEGVVTDAANRDRIRELLLFTSSETAPEVLPGEEEEGEEVDITRQYTSLADYVERMSDDQDAIYYITGPSRQAVEKSPHLEAFLDRGYEVLYLTDPYDEIMLGTLDEFEGKKLVSVGRGEVELGSEEEREKAKAEREEQEKAHKSLLEFLQKELGDHVKEVRLSSRLTSSAACLVGEEGQYGPHFTRMLKQAGHGNLPDMKRILEVNPNHPLLEKMQSRYDANQSDELLPSYAQLLYGQALLAEGSPLPDPVAFSENLSRLMVHAI